MSADQEARRQLCDIRPGDHVVLEAEGSANRYVVTAVEPSGQDDYPLIKLQPIDSVPSGQQIEGWVTYRRGRLVEIVDGGHARDLSWVRRFSVFKSS